MSLLPDAFADLEPFAAWCLATERERYAKRLASTMPEMQAFYDAITLEPRRRSSTATSSSWTTCPTRSSTSCGCCTRW